MKLTAEQEEIIARVAANSNIKAFAGTGKTTTLVALAARNPDQQYLYLAFNKSVQIEAAKKFPKNVVCKTIHAIAYQAVGQHYRAKLGSNRLFTINQITQDYRKAYFAYSTLKNYLHSADEKIGEQHINKQDIMTAPNFDITECLGHAQGIWERMVDEQDSTIRMEHDGYLKLFQLTGNRFPLPVNYILFDEAQDSNNVVYDLLVRADIPIVAVGDHHQSIYGFRGAVNSLKHFKGTRFQLTKSFRFGENISGLANEILQRFKHETSLIQGNGMPDKVHWRPNSLSYDPKIKTMKISRSNSGVIDCAIEALQNEQPFHIAGGVNEELFKTTRSVAGAKYHVEEAIKDPVIRHFYRQGKEIMENIKEYAEKTRDKEIDRALQNCEKYGEEIFRLLDKIKEKNQRVTCPLWFATAHKAKGLEAPRIIINDDFGTFVHDNAHNIRQGKFPLIENGFQEVNLLYVALTRAQEHLEVNDNLRLFRQETDRYQNNTGASSAGKAGTI